MKRHPFRFKRSQVILMGCLGLLALLAASRPLGLVLPTLIIGTTCLLLSQCDCICNHRRLRSACLVLSSWGLILGAGLAIANSVLALLAQSRGVPIAMSRKSQQSSGKYLYITGPGNKLGFNYAPSQVVQAKSWRETGRTQRFIYSANYTIDEAGNRKTCLSNSTRLQPNQSTVLFVGDSFTMGEGLNDCETLPSLFAMVSGMHATNAATNGYGPHQAMKLLEDDQLLRPRIGGKKIRLVVYRMIREHLQRLSGRSPWDAFGPCYQLNPITQQLEFKGSFSQCIGPSKVTALSAWTVANELMKSNEPLTYRLGTTLVNLTFSGLKQPITTQTRRLFVAMIARMKRQALRQGAPLVVVLEDNDPDCHPDKLSEELVRALAELEIPVVRGSQLISQRDCLASRFAIPGDGHPNKAYNLLLAQRLHQQFFQSSAKAGNQRP